MSVPKLTQSTQERIQAILTEAVQTTRIPALVFGASSADGEICFCTAGKGSFNDNDNAENDIVNPSSHDLSSTAKVTPESVFWICSQSKMIASIAALQLVENGLLDLETPVANIISELADPVVLVKSSTAADLNDPQQPEFRPPTTTMCIKHLLDHSSGLGYPLESERVRPHHAPTTYTRTYSSENPIGEFFDHLKGGYPGVPLKHDPGSSFSYGYSADVLGFIISRVSRKSLDEYYKQHIFEPLGITSASFYLTPDIKSRLVPLAFREPGGGIVPWTSSEQVPLIEQDPKKLHLHLAGLGVYCSMKDYLTLLRHMLQILSNKVTSSVPLLHRSSVEAFFRRSPNFATSNDDEHEGERVLRTLYGPILRGVGDTWSCGLCVNTRDIEVVDDDADIDEMMGTEGILSRSPTPSLSSSSSSSSLLSPSPSPTFPSRPRNETEAIFGFGYKLGPTRRRRRAAFSGGWYGWAGTYHFIDPSTGIAAVLGAQILPTRDHNVVRLWEKLETVLYDGLE